MSKNYGIIYGKGRIKKIHTLECPRRLCNGKDCDKPSIEVRTTKEGESVHKCPSHGYFKVKYDGSIQWLRR